MFDCIKKVIAAAEVLCYIHNVSIFDWSGDGKLIVIEGADENGLSFEMDIRITRQEQKQEEPDGK